MLTFAGMDEAGLGPLLGPLCLGFACYEASREVDFWKEFPGEIARGRDPGRLAVADSKKIYPGTGGLARLEETVLGFHLAFQGNFPETAGAFLTASPLPPNEYLPRHPWYKNLDRPLPRAGSREKIEALGKKLARAFRRRNIRWKALGSRVVPEREWNHSLKQTRNKAESHFHHCGQVMQLLIQDCRASSLEVDRLGMRIRYADHLLGLFPGTALWVLTEKKGLSRYQLEGEFGKARISFLTRGDEKSFLVALASMFAKYSRELLMECWNDFFGKIAPEVKPTAGYYTDARRYLREASSKIQKARIDLGTLVRER